ncbi:MAG: S1 RNA-binding domain-containing protein [Planctomycetes bacterium]|nr:S1 RNA-binding domain-containing protein [Planctomycetota bacterium]
MSIDPRELDDEDLNREIDDALGDLAPGELEHLAAPTPLAQPDEKGRIPGRILGIRGADVFVDIGGKSEGVLTLDEFEPDQPPTVGEQRTFVVQGIDQECGLTRLSLREVRREADWESLQIGDVIEARVTGSNIGGLELMIHNQRVFMPMSQIDLVRRDDLATFLNQRLECEIVELDRKGRNLVVSRRRVLERQREETRQELRYTLAEGQVRTGRISRLTDYGAFVDIGGIDGLLHVSDMSYARIKHPSDILKVGDEIEVQVLKIDLVRDRISLGLKQLAPDPWNVVEANYRAHDVVEGRVTKLMDFGAFVELELGVEGLIPISEMSWTQHVRHPRDLLNEGDGVRVAVLTVDPDKRRISLSLRALGDDPWSGVKERYQADAIVSGRVTRVTNFGAFIQLEEGVEGLAHISELSDQHVRRVSDVAEPGQVRQCRILSVDTAQRRIALSLKGIPGSPSEAEQMPATAPQAPPPERKRKRPLRGGLQH